MLCRHMLQSPATLPARVCLTAAALTAGLFLILFFNVAPCLWFAPTRPPADGSALPLL